MTTVFLDEFGYRERQMAIELLIAWNEKGLPADFEPEGTQIMMNRNSGEVFLTNHNHDVCIKANGNWMAKWHYCSNCGHEGFAEDCRINQDDQTCNQCAKEAV